MNADEILSRAKDQAQFLREARRYLHSNAEVGFDMKMTSEFIIGSLVAMGYNPIPCGRAGTVAVIEGKTGDRTVLLRADTDALLGEEDSGEEFASKNGKMHACGHDLHTAMLLGAAKILKDTEADICGRIKLVFQPAEEIFEGARDMISSGLIDSPRPDCGMAIHVITGLPFSTGKVMIPSGGISAPSADHFNITVYGKGCHGASPSLGIDPITVAAHTVIGLQEISARELPSGEKAVITVGRFDSGASPNSIPDKAELSGTARAFSEDTRKFLKDRMTCVSEKIAAAFRAKSEMSFDRGCPALYQHPEAVSSAVKYMNELLGSEAVITEESNPVALSGMSGSEDFAYIAKEIPSVMISLFAGNCENGYVYPQHHEKVRFDEDALSFGAAIYAYFALRWLEDNK